MWRVRGVEQSRPRALEPLDREEQVGAVPSILPAAAVWRTAFSALVPAKPGCAPQRAWFRTSCAWWRGYHGVYLAV